MKYLISIICILFINYESLAQNAPLLHERADKIEKLLEVIKSELTPNRKLIISTNQNYSILVYSYDSFILEYYVKHDLDKNSFTILNKEKINFTQDTIYNNLMYGDKPCIGGYNLSSDFYKNIPVDSLIYSGHNSLLISFYDEQNQKFCGISTNLLINKHPLKTKRNYGKLITRLVKLGNRFNDN